MFLIESITRQNIDLAFIHFSFIFTFARVKFLTRLTEASITDEKQFSQNVVIKIDHM